MKQNSKKIVKAVGVGLGAAAISAALLTGCDRFSPSQQELQGVYGPPPDLAERPYDPAEDEPEDVYGPPIDDSYNPADDEADWVYGPPGDDADWAADW